MNEEIDWKERAETYLHDQELFQKENAILRYQLIIAKEELECIEHGCFCGFFTPKECEQIAHRALVSIEKVV